MNGNSPQYEEDFEEDVDETETFEEDYEPCERESQAQTLTQLGGQENQKRDDDVGNILLRSRNGFIRPRPQRWGLLRSGQCRIESDLHEFLPRNARKALRWLESDGTPNHKQTKKVSTSENQMDASKIMESSLLHLVLQVLLQGAQNERVTLASKEELKVREKSRVKFADVETTEYKSQVPSSDAFLASESTNRPIVLRTNAIELMGHENKEFEPRFLALMHHISKFGRTDDGLDQAIINTLREVLLDSKVLSMIKAKTLNRL